MNASRSVVIVGQYSMQNRLLARLIDERLGCACQVRAMSQSSGVPVPPEAIAVLDVAGMSTKQIEAKTHALLASGRYRSIALMNAEQGATYSLAYTPGVRGVFPRGTSQEQLLKGLQAMRGGEYWLPRSVLATHFERTRSNLTLPSPNVELTPKERETLRGLVSGQSNRDIARDLAVSPHTVKAHLYNLFRKIGAKNRVQAVTWAMENLRGAAPAAAQAAELTAEAQIA